LQKNDFTIVAVSRLVGIKNPSSVVDVFEQSADEHSRLVYIGDGPLRDALVAKCKTAGLENKVQFTGLIEREKVFEYLLNASLFVSLSRGEGLPVSVLEAMACGCPVLLSDIPPHREIAKDVDFIPLVELDDIAGFAREIRKFREMSVSDRIAIGQKCRQLVEERFSLPVMLTAYEEVYAQISGRPVSSLSKTQAFKGIKP
jgi:glycosyltransferase involved in cell wall biosynthesis